MVLEKNILIPDWKKNFPEIICGFTLPVFGNQALTRKSVTNNKTTKQNRIDLADNLNINSKNVFYPYQAHSDAILNNPK